MIAAGRAPCSRGWRGLRRPTRERLRSRRSRTRHIMPPARHTPSQRGLRASRRRRPTPGVKTDTWRCCKQYRVFSQNCRGLKTADRVAELQHVLHSRRAFAACVQETWRCACEESCMDGCLFLCSGLQQQSGRGSQGVGIWLSRSATDLWRQSGAEKWTDDGPRVISLRLLGARRFLPR